MKPAVGAPLLDGADGAAVEHDGVVDIVKKLSRVSFQQARIERVEHFPLEDDGIVFRSAAKQSPARQHGARANVDVELEAALGECVAQRFDAEPEGRLLEIVGDNQDARHAGGIVGAGRAASKLAGHTIDPVAPMQYLPHARGSRFATVYAAG